MTNFAPTGPQDFNGVRGKDPSVELVLNGNRVLFAERYSVRMSILTQPAAFSLTLGTGGDLTELLDRVAPNQRFQLRIDGRQVMTGYLDGYSTSGPSGILQVEGRDALAPLHDAYLLQEQTFKDATYAQLVRKVMDVVGLKDTKLVYSNRANRAAIMGFDPETAQVSGQAAGKRPRAVEDLTLESGQGGGIKKHIQSQLGERAYEFLKRHLDRAGLFLWAAADGSYVLSEPNTAQGGLMMILRSQGSTPEFSTVVDHTFQNKTTDRFSSVVVYTRGETKKAGRAQAQAAIVDSEMTAWGYTRPLALRDPNADTVKKAEFMARRKLAESRRKGWRLTYKLSEHRTGSKVGKQLIWAPDSMVDVQDERLGVRGFYWIETVIFSSDPQRSVTVELMRPEDLVFGDAPT